ncbi:MAG: choice-of-anchor D domain-containing protein, partial [Terriglobales bacterium]
AGSASGNVTVTSNASNPTLTIPLSGTGLAPGALGANPASLSFGSVTVGNKQSLSETVTNTGGTSVTISQVAASGTGFSLSGITTPVTLTAGQSAGFTVTFTPTAAGSASGDVTVTSNASNPTLTIPLSGTGVTAPGQLTVTPTTLPLGSVVVGTSGTASGSLTASGTSVTVTAASSNNSVFSVGGLSLPVTIPAGQSAPFTVTFSPVVTGAASGTLTFTSNAQPSTTTEALTGTGTPEPTYTVNLSWTASTSPNISGYNIYRAVYTSSCGSFSKINPALNTSTLYTDSVVSDGTYYCYATTAVNSSDEESGYSNIVSNVQIPAP